jgi:hypothetical protein
MVKPTRSDHARVASRPKSSARASRNTPILKKMRGSMTQGSERDYLRYLDRKYR